MKKYYSKIGYVMYIWASLVAYSRIYMGVHYPGDVIVGAAVGMIVGFVVWRIYRVISIKMTSLNCFSQDS